MVTRPEFEGRIFEAYLCILLLVVFLLRFLLKNVQNGPGAYSLADRTQNYIAVRAYLDWSICTYLQT